MTTPTILTRLLDRLPEFYKQEGTYNKCGFTETGRYYFEEISLVHHSRQSGFGDNGFGEGGFGGGYVDTGKHGYDLDEIGQLIFEDSEISSRGLSVEIDLLITGHTNYKFGTILVQEEKRIDGVVSEVKEAHQVDNVSGINLDRLAKIFGLSREDRTDDELRAFLRSAVSGLIGGGTAPNLRAAVALITAIPEVNIEIADSGTPADIIVEVPKKYVTSELEGLITKYKPAGVSFTLIYGEACKWNTGKWDECVWT